MSSSVLPSLTSAQVKQVDAICAERFGIPVDWLMEAAGWQVARFVDRPAVVVCGVGNNAGDGLAAAQAGMIVFDPGPWYPPQMPLTSSVGRAHSRSVGVKPGSPWSAFNP